MAMVVNKCDRCGGENKALLEVMLPRDGGEDEEDKVYLNMPTHLCQDCVLDYARTVKKWWDDLPI